MQPYLLIGDWHWTMEQPRSRQDNYYQAQQKTLDWIKSIRNDYNATIIQAGDLFDYWKQPQELLTYLIENMPPVICCCGQHDLPRHSMDLYHKSAMAVLHAAGIVSHPHYAFSWNEKIKDTASDIGIAHIPIYHLTNPYKSDAVGTAERLLDKLNYKLLLTGDNHQQFVVKKDGKILVNPGSVHRTTAAQIDHEPAIYIYDGSDVERIPIPQFDAVVSREHIDIKNATDMRIQQFVGVLSTGYEHGLDFMSNLDTFFRENKTDNDVIDVVYECCENKKGE